MQKYYGDSNKAQSDPVNQPSKHPLSRRGRANTAQAHHLIVTEVIGEEEWPDYCATFGYDINHYKNGVMLPSNMKIACDVGVPLHRSNHSKAPTNQASINYVSAVRDEVLDIKEKAENAEYCTDTTEDFIAQMNAKSKTIFEHVKNFRWALTEIGMGFQSNSPLGCKNCNNIPDAKASSTGCLMRSTNLSHHPALIIRLQTSGLLVNRAYNYKEFASS